MRLEFLQRPRAMTDLVFHRFAQLGKRNRESVGDKQRIITESAGTMRREIQTPLTRSVEQMR